MMNDIREKLKNKKLIMMIKFISTLFWLTVLSKTKAIYIPYLIIGIVSVYSINRPNEGKKNKREQIGIMLLSMFYTSLITLANYDIFENMKAGVPFNLTLFLLTGFITFHNLLSFLYLKFQTVNFKDNDSKIPKTKKDLVYAFFTPFLIIVFIDFVYLFLVGFPGNLSPDSIDQLNQIHNGVYSNHHPFFHTMLIKLFYSIGYALFKTPNLAVATYSLAQIFMMASIFSFGILTLKQIGVKKGIVNLNLAIYALLPYHWMYASTMWKDVPFGGVCLLTIICLYRIKNNIGKLKLNYILFFVSSLGMCLLRSNGMFVYIIFLIFLLIIEKNKQVLLLTASMALVMGIFLKGPVLNFLNVTSPDTIEKLSIPLQQISRVVHEGKDLGKNNYEYIDEILGVDEIKQTYVTFISDPIKNLARGKDANKILDDNLLKFIKIWASIGIKNPYEYIVAWVDQTKGYWNAGYNYWVTSNSVWINDYGIGKQVVLKKLNNLVDALMNEITTNKTSLLSLSVSTGFYTWIYLLLISFSFLNKRREFIFLIPGIAIILSLLIATPVFNEFRYAYGLYTMMPFAFTIALFKKS